MPSGRAVFVLLLFVAVVALAAAAWYTLGGRTGPGSPAGPMPAEEELEPAMPVVAPEVERTPVRGLVVRLGSLAPVAGADVTFGDQLAKTDPAGRFRLAEAPVGPGILRIRAEGAIPFRRELVVTTGTSDLGEFRIAYGTVLRGRVVDADARPVPDARIRILERSRYSAGRWWEGPDEDQIRMGIEILDEGRDVPGDLYSTEADGRFRVEGLSPGVYFVSAAAEGHATVSKDRIRLPEEGDVEVDLVLAGGVSLSGRVLDFAGHEVDGAIVIATPWNDAVNLPYAIMERTVSTAGGTFRFGGLGNGGSYLLFARAPDGEIGTAVRVSAPARDVRIKVGPRYTLYGTVVDDETGAPVEGAHLYTILARKESDSSGRYELSGAIRSNPFPMIWVRAEGYENAVVQLKLSLSMLVSPRVEQNVRLKKVVPATIRVTVRDTDGRAIPGATVSLRDLPDEHPAGEGTTNEEGLAVIAGVPPEGLLAVARKEGYVQIRVRVGRSGEPIASPSSGAWVSLAPGATGEQELTLIAVETASGTVHDRAGQPVEGVTVFTSGGKVGRTDEKGRFAAGGVPVGMRTRLSFRKPGYVDEFVDLEAGQREGIEVVLSRGGTLSGVVVDEAGKPVGGVSVTAEETEERDSGIRAQSDELGKFLLEGLLPGDYSLILYRTGFAAARAGPFPIREAETRENLRLVLEKGLSVELVLVRPGGDETEGTVLFYGPLDSPKEGRTLRRFYLRPGRDHTFQALPGTYRILGSPATSVKDAGATEVERRIDEPGKVLVELGTEILRLLVRPKLPPNAEVTVMVHRTEPEEPSVRFWFGIGEDGVFRSPPVPPGTYELGFFFNRRPRTDSWEYREVKGLEPGTKIREVDLEGE